MTIIRHRLRVFERSKDGLTAAAASFNWLSRQVSSGRSCTAVEGCCYSRPLEGVARDGRWSPLCRTISSSLMNQGEAYHRCCLPPRHENLLAVCPSAPSSCG